MRQSMYYIGECRICGGGLRGVRICPAGHAAVLCDECEAVWTDPDSDRPMFSTPREAACPTCGADLLGEGSHWAGMREVRASGWREVVRGRYEVKDKSLRDPPSQATTEEQ